MINEIDLSKSLNSTGFYVVRSLVDSDWVNRLSLAANKVLINRENLSKNNCEIKFNPGIALHALIDDDTFIDFIQYLVDLQFFKVLEDNFFKAKCIINSFSIIEALPKQANFASYVHRDLRFFSSNFPTMVNCLLMLDDFTESNGATHILPFSCSEEIKPDNELFSKNSIQIVGKKGDVLIFNSNTWHSAGINETTSSRRAIPITICRSFMKQLFDYPRAIGYEKMSNFSVDLQQVLGYHSRVPSSLIEWFKPDEERFYRKFQD
jgi:ectoine hydroxylase-related dioxygenase (phytanoyl-CoA dioxygenase family)